MNVAELNVPVPVKRTLQERGIEDLYPPQVDAINTGVLEGKNLVLASPTASGKTLIAELCALKHVLERSGKVLYLTPLRALTWEKFEEFKAYTDIVKPDGRKIRVGVSSGDMDNSSPWLQAYDIVICTNEKCDSLLRHRSPWMNGISLVIADEVHLIGTNRGPTLEISLARLRQMSPNIQILALSATISNTQELAGWLDAESVTTEWRPVVLREGVALGNHITFNDEKVRDIKLHNKQIPINLALNALKDKGQALIFVESRRRAMSTAKAAANGLKKTISKIDETNLVKIAADIAVHGEKTRLTDDLVYCVERGTAFHHAGLNREHRRLVEDGFKKGAIKIIAATPTLASGVNLPARTVVIGSYKRFAPGYGMQDIKTIEYKQMAGRAGRPQYDDIGEALLIANSIDNQEFIFDKYIRSKPERIDSRLSQESQLRGHILAAISSEYANTEQGLSDFFETTFFGYNFGSQQIEHQQYQIIKFLLREKMIEYEGRYLQATSFGRRISELYIDPYSAVIIRDGLSNYESTHSDFSLLHLICSTSDMRPKLRPRSKDFDLVDNYKKEHNEEFLVPIFDVDEYSYEYQELLGEVKTAMVLEAWIKEVSENDLLERYNVQPGDRYSAVTNGDWLLYAAHELADILS
ncbi:MAG: DEAD/DEAH box helicase, partial [Candidatus Bathyarchaeota archaeon]|nr:DEAD/DEAH box helicase [Candidatus Bathyarchaeota archaeon]